MKISEPGRKHISALGQLLENVRPLDIGLIEHEYNLPAFGSYMVVLGRRYHRLRFLWDGREYTLDISRAEFEDLNSPAHWVPYKSIQVAGGEDVFGIIYATVCREFASR